MCSGCFIVVMMVFSCFCCVLKDWLIRLFFLEVRRLKVMNMVGVFVVSFVICDVVGWMCWFSVF